MSAGFARALPDALSDAYKRRREMLAHLLAGVIAAPIAYLIGTAWVRAIDYLASIAP